MQLNLLPHPAALPSKPDFKVWANVDYAGAFGATATTNIWFGVGAPASRFVIAAAEEPSRADELWKTTCFELFCTKPGLAGYYEFNFSPSFEWAAYAFDGYRTGMQKLPAEEPEITIGPAGGLFFLAAEPWPADLVRDATRLALSAVIEEVDGTKSYWALKHPPGAPDFHHPDCFALELPAPEAP